MKKTIIALDYDETYTCDPILWDCFIRDAQRHGHTVVFVTYRDKDLDAICEDYPRPPERYGIKIFYTAGVAKKWYMKHFGPKGGVDIWIDDSPESIFENSAMTPNALHKWRRK